MSTQHSSRITMYSSRSKVIGSSLLLAAALLPILFHVPFHDKVVRTGVRIIRPIQRARKLRPVPFTAPTKSVASKYASNQHDQQGFSLALVRTISAHDAKSLVESFEAWEEFALGIDCHSSHHVTDLIISFSRIYDEQLYPSITAALKDVSATYAATDGWSGCIRSVKTFAANLSEHEDLYLPALAEEGNPMWVNGPNR